MADINVERKGPSIWPWVIGLLVLALLIWAIAEMVDTDEQVAVEEQPVEQVTEPPAAVPEPGPVQPEGAVTEMETLLPLGPEDTGMRTEIAGTVVGEPTDEGFWVETVDNTVVFVRSDRSVETGERVDALMGTIQTAQAQQATQWADQARLSAMEDFDTWDVQDEHYLDAMAAQPAPARPMPGDTVDGRY